MDDDARYAAWQNVGRSIYQHGNDEMLHELRDQMLTGGSSSDLRRAMDFTDGSNYGWPRNKPGGMRR
jgi:hypothetical protein